MGQPTEPSPTFPNFPKLPCELRFMVWSYAIQEARKVGLHSENYATRSMGQRRAHFFTIFDTHNESHLVSQGERLHKQSSFLQYTLAAPRMDESSPGSWLEANTNAFTSEWSVCAESRAYAANHLKEVRVPMPFGLPSSGSPPILDTCNDSCIPRHVSQWKCRSSRMWRNNGMSEDKIKEKMALWWITGNPVEKYVGKFTSNGETHTFTVLKERDLVCLRPLNMDTFDWNSARSTLLQLKTDDMAFEMRRGWTSPGNGTVESWHGLAGRISGEGMVWTSDSLRRFWIIDYRIHLKQGAVWPVTKHRKSKMRLTRFHGRLCDFVEVHNVEELIWEFDGVEGEPKSLNYHEDLVYSSTLHNLPMRTGVLACVPRG
ncbi:hypothetical protein BR93DRAFT_976668 [Coniochaeta sp. PMI_546]|nr:hypothetical protein BR93DRAFT_976668 [Coniochaeta sp. PMI_546]